MTGDTPSTPELELEDDEEEEDERQIGDGVYIQHTRRLGKFFAAFARAQGKFPASAEAANIGKVGFKAGAGDDGQAGPGREYLYADLGSVIEATREPLSENGIAVIPLPSSMVQGMVTVTLLLGHAKSGQWISTRLSMPVGGSTPQAYGSALTYCTRYLQAKVLNIHQGADDDGKLASETPPENRGRGRRNRSGPPVGYFDPGQPPESSWGEPGPTDRGQKPAAAPKPPAIPEGADDDTGEPSKQFWSGFYTTVKGEMGMNDKDLEAASNGNYGNWPTGKLRQFVKRAQELSAPKGYKALSPDGRKGILEMLAKEF